MPPNVPSRLRQDDGGPLRIRGRAVDVSRTLVMGVVNANPDSFSDAGTHRTVEDQLRRCDRLVEDGADIVDIGGQTAITGRPELDARIEAERVVPLVEWMHRTHPSVLVSVDTYKPLVVDAVLAAGASIINDVSGLRHPEIVPAVTAHGAALVIMHTAAPPKVHLERADLYGDVTTEVVAFLEDRMAQAVDLGLSEDAIILDPGPDFTKTPHQTVELLRGIGHVQALGRPVLLPVSRKDFLGAIVRRSPGRRDAATHAAIAWFAATGPSIVRVHDVAGARDVISTIEVLAGHRRFDPEETVPDELRHEPPAGTRRGWEPAGDAARMLT